MLKKEMEFLFPFRYASGASAGLCGTAGSGPRAEQGDPSGSSLSLSRRWTLLFQTEWPVQPQHKQHEPQDPQQE